MAIWTKESKSVTPLLEDEGRPPEQVPTSGDRLLRSSALMAVDTLASRITGFLRTVLILAALGSGSLGDAFNTANTIPNQVYDILLGGVLTAAHAPLLIRARQTSEKYGEEYEQRLFTASLSALAVITLLAMLAAPILVAASGNKFSPAQQSVAKLFLLFFLPQAFFYGFSSVAGASLTRVTVVRRTRQVVLGIPGVRRPLSDVQ